MKGKRESFAERLQKVSATAKNAYDFSTTMNQAICTELMVREVGTQQEIIKIYQQVWASNPFSKYFWGMNLENASLIGVNLAGANLTGVNLTKANLSVANLSGASLARANLSGANLIHAELDKADLRGACLVNAHGSSVRLRGADLREADLREAYLVKAKLTGANLQGAVTVGTNFTFAKVTQEQIASSINTPQKLQSRVTALVEADPTNMTATQKQDLPNTQVLYYTVKELAQQNDPQNLYQAAQVQLKSKFPTLVQPGFSWTLKMIMRETYRTVVDALNPGRRTNALPIPPVLLPTIMELTQSDPQLAKMANHFTKALLSSREKVPSAGATMAEALKPFVTEGERPFLAGFVGKLEQERAQAQQVQVQKKDGCTIC